MAVDKVVSSFDLAVADIFDGATIHIGGFGIAADYPSYLIAALVRSGVKDITLVTNIPGFSREQIDMMRERSAGLIDYPSDFTSPGLLVELGQVKKGIVTFASASGRMEIPFETLLRRGEVELGLVGQGSLAERIRAARAGIPAFYTPVGAGTATAEGKEVRELGGRMCVLETALRADFALVRGHVADRWGNIVYRGTSRTFNATMAGAADVTIVEVDRVEELGGIDPEHVVTASPYVERVVVRPDVPVADWTVPC